ncbi:MAG: HAD family phosphatase [Clostridia bacterium]|nr:HAD family phosphatase [Clostridia bacterium]
MNKFKGVIFDLDGTLLDTEKLYRRFWVEASRQLGYPMEDRHALMIRSMAAAYAEPLLKREVCAEFDYHSVRALRRTIMEEYIDQNGVDPKPDLIETLRALREKGLKIGLATATPEHRARKYLRMVNAEPYFDAVTCADMVRRGKPQPDIYLLACERTGVAPGEALAVEDAPTGIRAAHDAGCAAVMVPDQDQPDEETRALCFAVAQRLSDIVKLV